MELVLNHVRILTMDEAAPLIEDGFVGIREGVYAFASSVQPRVTARRFVDGRGKTLVPLAAVPVLGELLHTENNGFAGEAGADCVLLEGLHRIEDLAGVPLSAIVMVICGGSVRWERTLQA